MQPIVFRVPLLLLIRVKNWKQTTVRFSDMLKRMGGKVQGGGSGTEKKAFSVSV